MVAKAEKSGGGEAAVMASNHQSRRSKSSFNNPSWLLCTIADLDERMKMMTHRTPNEISSDSFAARANSYYHERPELLELLKDLYNNYLSLADRYCHALNKKQSICSSPVPPLKFDETNELLDSDNESSLSFQIPILPLIDADMVIADLVMKTVDYEIILNELSVVDKKYGESSRKTEIQKNLLDVLESERLILLNDNASLGYRVNALVEENKGLACESLFLKRKATELARCVLKTREDYRVCMLSRKIEDLQTQIYGLEKRNTEYYDKLVKQEEKNNKSINGGGLRKCLSLNVKKKNGGDLQVEGLRVKMIWDKLKKFDLFTCGSHLDSAGC